MSGRERQSGRRAGRRQIRAPVLAEILQTIAPKQEPAVNAGRLSQLGKIASRGTDRRQSAASPDER